MKEEWAGNDGGDQSVTSKQHRSILVRRLRPPCHPRRELQEGSTGRQTFSGPGLRWRDCFAQQVHHLDAHRQIWRQGGKQAQEVDVALTRHEPLATGGVQQLLGAEVRAGLAVTDLGIVQQATRDGSNVLQCGVGAAKVQRINFGRRAPPSRA